MRGRKTAITTESRTRSPIFAYHARSGYGRRQLGRSGSEDRRVCVAMGFDVSEVIRDAGESARACNGQE